MGMQMNSNDSELPSYFEDLREIVMTVEPRLRPIPEMRMHVSRFLDGADMDEVYPDLFLGDCDAAMNESYLLKNRITHVLNAAGNAHGPAPVKTGPNFYKSPSIKYLGLNLIDLPFINISVHFERASVFIEEALKSGRVLVHCRQGRSRSAAIVVAFLMMYRGMTAAAALTMIRKKREIRPNNGFLQHLANLDLKLFQIKLEKMREESSSSSASSSSSSLPQPSPLSSPEQNNKKESESNEEDDDCEEEGFPRC
ncbi:dual specificity protein phosphatase 3-like [Eriocheir sinensis]|uniref:dual specificity protein phosphatase 3-like n=1 Tax=Eriocheir sinensis TaxID=95602 RepID=UPI0021C9329E|nr:dual specificity protein phosphatase 3-like [Eriocheir sinensis]XP_050727596.1 dual specificity protein phosphatase 3-like [Eriocheir sinensis]XP_050727597.1 dual specificity protein phosphatase 3-like [Eriocheir sinensis]XP_050727598.1 dual specificity protein phosphatase 3-like [Eriocheir sinensis]XP_050727599.1 dual specificity protein phosphatase 3-like [Eriocheir sinensis]XP_050727600.1 dual specificity protein phosphatase 3-like [Eriocheir sinensis]XP_050727601.1 dual specificity pro